MKTDLVIIIIAIFFSAFFSGMEIAFVSLNRVFLEVEKKQKNFFSKILIKITKFPSKFMATMLIGNNVALVIYGLFSGKLILDIFFPEMDQTMPIDFRYIIYQILISAFLILITAEFLPKVFFQIYSNRLFKYLSPAAYIFYLILSPISSLLDFISNTVLNKYTKTKQQELRAVFSKDEIGEYINEELGNDNVIENESSEIQIFQNALEFSSVRAREVMVPRAEIISVDRYTTISEINKRFISKGLSKILIHRENIDHVLGYVSLLDMFKKPKNIKSIIKSVEFIPETMLISDILNILTKKNIGVAVVIDEYGGSSGIITIEDIIEELFGEIEDEHDLVNLIEKEINSTNFIFSARLEVDYLNSKYQLDIPEIEDYETLGGYIVHNTQEIPKKGDLLKIGNLEFEIKDVTETKIETIFVKIIN
ncbi:MAG: hemolysin [Flavobacteriaceae bacterium]|nr:hemolysin [Flavobacteriaceae bacterium]